MKPVVIVALTVAAIAILVALRFAYPPVRRSLPTLPPAIASTRAPSVRLRAVPATSPVLGASRLGGRPDLPEDTRWPVHAGRALSFLAQFRLADLPRAGSSTGLPSDGHLFFFYDTEDMPWGFDPNDRGAWAVLYAKSTAHLSPATPDPALKPPREFTAASLEFDLETTLPDPMSDVVERLGLDSTELDDYAAYYDSQADADLTLDSHLLGHPQLIQGDMQLDCQLASNGINVGGPEGYKDPRLPALKEGAADWRLLLQLDSHEDLGMMWGDSGRLYFWIREMDLQAKRFDATWLVLQCY